MSTTPIEAADPRALHEFAQVAAGVLRREGLEAQVRLLPWTATTGRLRVRCHVYAGSTGLFHGSPTWVWWSPLVETPEGLRAALEDALRNRPLVERRRIPRPPTSPL